MAKFKVRKLIRLIDEGNPSKFKSYVRKHKINVNNVRLDHDQTLLHLACYLGQDDILRIILKLGADPLLCDKNGNLPIHIAARTVLNGKQYAFSDLVLPLIQQCSQTLDIPNKDGETARFLLHNVHDFITDPGVGFNDEASVASSIWDDDERAWAERLVDEWQDEYNATWGFFERSDFNEKPKESFDEWADRLSREYAGKHRKRKLYSDHSESNKRQRISSEPLRNQPLADEYFQRLSQMKQECLKSKKQKYEQQCLDVFSSHNKSSMSYNDVPWPTYNKSDDVMEVLLCDIKSMDIAIQRKYLREQQIQWHPDRFMQRCGKRLLPADAETILSRVKEISQIINRYIEQLKG